MRKHNHSVLDTNSFEIPLHLRAKSAGHGMNFMPIELAHLHVTWQPTCRHHMESLDMCKKHTRTYLKTSSCPETTEAYADGPTWQPCIWWQYMQCSWHTCSHNKAATADNALALAEDCCLSCYNPVWSLSASGAPLFCCVYR